MTWYSQVFHGHLVDAPSLLQGGWYSTSHIKPLTRLYSKMPCLSIFTAVFWVSIGQLSRLPSDFLFHQFPKRTPGDKWHRFVWARRPTCHPTNSVKVLQWTHNIRDVMSCMETALEWTKFSAHSSYIAAIWAVCASVSSIVSWLKLLVWYSVWVRHVATEHVNNDVGDFGSCLTTFCGHWVVDNASKLWRISSLAVDQLFLYCAQVFRRRRAVGSLRSDRF